MISIYHEDDGKLGTQDGFYGNGIFHWNDIDVSAEEKTMSIRRGWGANRMVYSLDGWTGRYGMPLEFLLSVHMATKMPDLTYDMTVAFKDIEVLLLLHPLDGVSAQTAYKKDFQGEKTDVEEYITYEEMFEKRAEGWSPTDSWTLSKEEAMNIIKMGIDSPSYCTHEAKTFEFIAAHDNGDGWIFDEDVLSELQGYATGYYPYYEGYGAGTGEFEDIDSEFTGMVVAENDEAFKSSENVQKTTDESCRGFLTSRAQEYGYNYEEVKKNNCYEESTEVIKGYDYYTGSCDSKSHVLGENTWDGKITKPSGKDHWLWCGHYGSHDTVEEPDWYYMAPNKCYDIEKTTYTREWEGTYKGMNDVIFNWTSHVFRVYEYPTYERKEENKKYVASYIVEYLIRDFTFDELVQKKILNPDGTTAEGDLTCSEDYEGGGDLKKCCSGCKKYIKTIMKNLKSGNDDDFDTYTPYISKVTGHWYRDVYFVSDSNKEFVQVDEEYEALMGERWTLYETDEETGQYVLYKLNSDGTIGDKFNGTQQDANEQGIPVTKKAETIKITDKDTDGNQLINWNKVNGVWTAYKLSDTTTTTGWELLYPEKDFAEEPYKSKMYVKMTTQDDIVQIEEGQRTQTNPKIKDIFLNNTYFKYDGSVETAQIIDQLRRKMSKNTEDSDPDNDELKMGELSADELKVTVEHDTNGNGTIDSNEKYTAKDFAGKVELTQNSLSAFSMLENTHTLDADYIYKDFKELVVELGYFTKEELSDETPRIFAFPVPEIGSYGFPVASLDKKENEFGTQLHSREDYEANVKNTMAALLASAPENTENPEGAGKETGDDSKEEALVIKKPYGNDIIRVADLNGTPIDRLVNIGDITNISASKYEFEATGSTATGTKTGDLTIDGVTYEVWKQTKSTCTLYSFAFIAHAYEGKPFDTYVKNGSSFINATGEGQGGNDYWIQGAGVTWECFEKAGISGTFLEPSAANVGESVSKALGEGKPVYFYGDLNASAGYHAVVLLGADSNGAVIYYDPGPGAVKTYGSSSSFAANLKSLLDNHFKHRIFIPDEVPSGVSKSGTAFAGYEGGESVVTPVTGILLEYGVYDDTIDPLTGEESRLNVDIKYQLNEAKTPTEEATPEGTVPPTEETPKEQQKVIDKVGYAKIMILDDETYLALEKQMSSSATKALGDFDSLVDKDGNYYENKALKGDILSDGASDKWTDADITLYGYKEFAELYSDFGVSGNIIYIDGFVCESPIPTSGEESEEESETTEEPSTEPTSSTEKLTLASFTPEYNASLYEKEEKYNLSSQDASNKLNNENEIKAAAPSVVKVTVDGKERIVIKEGTVIGRTMSNKELAESRGETYTPPTPTEESTETSTETTETTTTGTTGKNNAGVLGNYLRIMMRDQEDTVVENVEEYMKLDEEGTAVKFNGDYSEEFLYWLGVVLEGLDLQDCINGYAIAEDIGDGTITAGPGVTNWCNALFWELGYEQYVNNIQGSNVGMNVGDKIPIDVLVDVMIAELDQNIASLEAEFPDNNYDEYQVAAIVSVYYNFGHVPNSLKDNLKNESDALEQVWLHLSDSQAAQYPGLPKRRKGEYTMFTKKKYVNVYSDLLPELQFNTSTPFTDYLNGENTVKY